jgi:hypothetical protein
VRRLKGVAHSKTYVSPIRVSYKNGVAVALALLFLWIGTQAVVTATHFDSSSLEKDNLFSSSILLQPERAELDQALDQFKVSVWDRERVELIGRLQTLLHDQLNRSPFDAQLWHDLAVLHAESSPEPHDRAWTLAQAWKFNNWNITQRFNVAHHCADEYERIKEVAPRLCTTIFRGLPETQSQRVLAYYLGVSEQRLTQVLAAEGLSFEELNK